MAVRERTLTLTEIDREEDGFPVIGMLDGKMWDDAVTEKSKIRLDRGVKPPERRPKTRIRSTSIWFSFKSWTGGRLMRSSRKNRARSLSPARAKPNELNAWKDTVKSFPGTLTRVISKFGLPSGADVIAGKPYRYVWHCHILEHEDNDVIG